MVGRRKQSRRLSANIRYSGKAYALFFGSRGASVVVNDLGGSFKGEGNSTKVRPRTQCKLEQDNTNRYQYRQQMSSSKRSRPQAAKQ